MRKATALLSLTAALLLTSTADVVAATALTRWPAACVVMEKLIPKSAMPTADVSIFTRTNCLIF